MIAPTQLTANNPYSQLQQLPPQLPVVSSATSSNANSSSISTAPGESHQPIYKNPAFQKVAKAGAVYAGTAVINTMLTGSPTTKVVSTKTVGKAADKIISLVNAVRGKKGEETEGDSQQATNS
jgi:hypothetical protein